MYHGLTGWGARSRSPYNRAMANARTLAADLLLRQDQKGLWVSRGLEEARAKLDDPRERGLLTELALGTVRTQGTLDAVLGAFSSRPVHKLDPALRIALRMGLYQLLFLSRIPDHAAVDQAVRWTRRKAGGKRGGFVNGVLRSVLRARVGPAVGAEQPRRDVPLEDGAAVRFDRDVFPDPARDLDAYLAARYSMPDWLVAQWRDAWGEERCLDALRGSATRPPLTLRARGGRPALVEALQAQDIPFDAPPASDAVLVREKESDALALVEQGLATVQDLTSQRVAPLLGAGAGDTVLDLCAAPGGKSLQLADLMQTGTVTACDVDPKKVKALATLSERMGEVDFRVQPVPTKGPLPFEAASFDGVLIDAPCSNTGVLRRRVEARWRLVPDDMTKLAAIQLDLLRRAAPLVRKGGRIVYSTCSLETGENEEVVEAFIDGAEGWSSTAAYRVGPSCDADGGCAFVLTRES